MNGHRGPRGKGRIVGPRGPSKFFMAGTHSRQGRLERDTRTLAIEGRSMRFGQNSDGEGRARSVHNYRTTLRPKLLKKGGGGGKQKQK